MDAIEVAAEVHVVLGPDLAEHLQELGAATVALIVLEPRTTEMGEFVLEPAGDDVDREAAAGQVVGGGAELGQDGGLPQSGVHRGDHLQPLGGGQSASEKLVDSCWYSAP